MQLNESIVAPHIDDESWLHQNKKLILRSVSSYSQAIVDRLADYDEFQAYIIDHGYCSKTRHDELLSGAASMTDAAFKHLCSSLSGTDIDLLYHQINNSNASYHTFFCIIWTIHLDYMVKSSKYLMELFLHTCDFPGRKSTTKLMKLVLSKYPALLSQWLGYDMANFIRFYTDIGKISFFNDDCIDLLLDSINNDTINQTKLFQLLNHILAKNNCSKQKKLDILFSMK